MDNLPRAKLGRRLDLELIARGLASSRTRAKASVESGLVKVNGKLTTKPTQIVADNDQISIEESETCLWVSRAALKLAHGLDSFDIEVDGRLALDLGASTGGFTQVLLARGARRVIAVDVGHGQIDAGLRADPRVSVLERLNVKDITLAHLGESPQIITSDLSFISLRKALPASLALAAPGASLVALIKPQFEVGRDGIGKGGIVKDASRVAAILEDIPAWLARDYGARMEGPVPSPIKGGDGNQEYLIHAVLP